MECKQTKIIQIKPEITEHVGIDYETTGRMGGDGGHGGYAKIKFFIEHGSTDVTIRDLSGAVVFQNNNFNNNGGGSIEISVFGDWELTGLTKNLKLLGLNLLKNEVTESSNY